MLRIPKEGNVSHGNVFKKNKNCKETAANNHEKLVLRHNKERKFVKFNTCRPCQCHEKERKTLIFIFDTFDKGTSTIKKKVSITESSQR